MCAPGEGGITKSVCRYIIFSVNLYGFFNQSVGLHRSVYGGIYFFDELVCSVEFCCVAAKDRICQLFSI